MSTEITLKNGVWIHETEWIALQQLIKTVEGIIRGTQSRWSEALNESYWRWRHAEMDIEDQARAVRMLTNIIAELTSEDEDVTLESVL